VKRHDIKTVLELTKPYTMVHEAGVKFTIHAAIEAIERDVPGDFIECGVWRGGCALAMLLAQRLAFGEVKRHVHLFDSFAGLPPANVCRDGESAMEWQETTGHNCVASLDDLCVMLSHFHFSDDDFTIWPGWFRDTLPAYRIRNIGEKIAVLRLDGDWYQATRECLDSLVPRVSNHGTVIIDDYFAWDGCTRAVHDYLSARDLPYRIRSLSNHSSAYFVKETK
jgi:hypothetical protein